MFSALATKIMFWALARVIFITAKIISWSNKLFFHGLPSKLLQLFYFRITLYAQSEISSQLFSILRSNLARFWIDILGALGVNFGLFFKSLAHILK
jgi:hypothetical protein